MPTVLPRGRIAPTRINPKILVLYSLPKVGKTSQLALLDDCLLLDAENGADMYNAQRVPVSSSKDIDDVITAIIAEGTATKAATGKAKFPYKYIGLDTLDKLEDFCIVSATQKYKRSVIGKNFAADYGPTATVIELPKGLGYWYLREEVKLYIERLARVCPFLILTSHVKDVNLEKNGVAMTKKDISLVGKLSEIVCAMADGIGYMYRKENKLMVNFETYEGQVMGSRFPHLAGKNFEFSWDKIYLPEEIRVPADLAEADGAASKSSILSSQNSST